MDRGHPRHAIRVTSFALLAALSAPSLSLAAGYKVVGWNDLGMHCVDGKDYSVYSILPPFNNIRAHIVDANGKLVKSPTGITVTYQSVADPAGSINKSSINKTNFWSYVQQLFGVALPLDKGLAGYSMPGAGNTARAMKFDPTYNWFAADGIPIMPYDDKGVKNYYPMMRLTAKNSSGAVLATTDIVLPVSDEMDCKSCHASGSQSTARPGAGWAYLTDPEKDYKANVLLIHDEKNAGNPVLAAALQKLGMNPAGLYATSFTSNRPFMCAACHSSNALPGLGVTGITPLTQAVHAHHATVIDPTVNMPLDAIANRSACYRCHPGSVTKCLRGAMGKATAPDGSMLMQCQSCHGVMSQVGAANRQGWLQEPGCQTCHTGTALQNSGQIRYTTSFDASGQLRQPANTTFATNGATLYRFSKGHGNLQCESCHGSTHAEFPSSHTNDNLQSIKLQGHAGVLAECTSCHATMPSTTTGGPHGLHPIGQSWVSQHGDIAERGSTDCRACHGLDYRGTVLSKTQGSRSFRTEHGTKTFPAGTIIGCYSCHNGPRGG
jgi:hypothetical protein